jgi:hypothetical protein
MPSNVSAIEIDKKLRDDFRRRVRDFGVSAEITDPVLAVLFRTFAQQLESLYAETDRIRLALLDELIGNLGMQPRAARPSQVLVRFLLDKGSQLIGAGTELVGEGQTGARFTFMTDVTVRVSEARIAFALTYQDGALRLLSSVELPEALQALRPSLEPVRVNLGPNPALFLAVENLPADHLSQHGLFFELGPDAYRIQQALQTEPWCLMNGAGELVASGILRPRPGNGGACSLEWLIAEPGSDDSDGQGKNAGEENAEEEVAALPTGFYGPRTFALPTIPASRRFRCKVPRGMEQGLTKIFGREFQKALGEERAWVRISLPADIPPLQSAVGGIAMHAATASNVECFNQTIVFEKQGTSIPIVGGEGASGHHLVAPLSILGEGGAPYRPETEPSVDPGVGRYAIRNSRIELRPALRPDGSRESYANVRLWVTNGAAGNDVGPGQMTGFLKKSQILGLRIANPVSAAGGTNGEDFAKARDRFAEALLARDRIVTRNDLINVARSFDSRISGIEIEPSVRRSKQGLKRVEHIKVRLDKEVFVDPRVEFPLLQDGLLRYLTGRFPLGTELVVDVIAS